MKKKLIALFAVMMILGTVGCSAYARQKQQPLDVLPLFSSQSTQANRLWVGTFQLAWNDLMDGIVKGPVLFETAYHLKFSLRQLLWPLQLFL